MDFPYPCLMFLADVDRVSAKTALGVAYWRPDACVGQLRLPGGEVDLGLVEAFKRIGGHLATLPETFDRKGH